MVSQRDNPKEVTDVKKFLSLAKGDEKQEKAAENKKTILIKESKKITKFKLRGKRYLYTFKTADKGKAQKLVASLPANIQKVNVGAKKQLAKKKKK